ncbi:hypothetical protein GGI43DRAFT_413914 [Trichoderma evansii]
MRTKKNEPAVQSLAVQAPLTLDLDPDDSEVGKDSISTPTSAYKILAACSTATLLNITATQFGKKPESESCWTTYPICDGLKFQEHTHLPLFVKQQNLDEICLLMVAILICLHWGFVFSLYCQHRWKQKFLPGIIIATFTTLLPIATLVQDPAMVFIGLLPIIIDIYTLACLVFDYAYTKNPRSQGFG